MVFHKTKLEFIEKEENSTQVENKEIKQFNYVFKFSKNNKFAEFFTTETKIFETWKNFLRYKCILSTFHEDFDVKKMIGKGSFAKVHKYFFVNLLKRFL